MGESARMGFRMCPGAQTPEGEAIKNHTIRRRRIPIYKSSWPSPDDKSGRGGGRRFRDRD